jgi:hypothetical protein
VIRPGPVTAVERDAHARADVRRETFDRPAPAFTEARCAALDGLRAPMRIPRRARLHV